MNFVNITSVSNNLIKYTVKLHNSQFRKQEKMIFVDGQKSIEGIISDGIEFEYIFVKNGDRIDDNLKAKNVVFVTDEILKKISTTKSPVSVAGIIKEVEVNINDFFELDKIALLDRIKDAGNLGTIIRSAVAFGIEGIILFGDCVDIHNTKTIRATAQNMFKIPIVATSDPKFIKTLKKTHKIISTVVNSDNDFIDYKFDNRFVIAFGSEADGLSSEISDLSDEKLTIMMENSVESINLGAFASIAFALIKLNKRLM